jgi:hypothetical protein
MSDERPPERDARDPDEPDPDFRAPSRLPTEPFDRWTGASLRGSIAVWFRMPRNIRSDTLRAAVYTMLLVVAVIAALAGLIWLVGWAAG